MLQMIRKGCYRPEAASQQGELTATKRTFTH
jgi:hypothetical protein